MSHLLRWAEAHGAMNVFMDGIGNLVGHLDEDPFVISHLLRAFLNVNLTRKAREIFCNCFVGQIVGWRGSRFI